MIEIWATDEHRIGLKPITRGVWAPIGERPVAIGHHRFEWLYVTGFVEPATGRTVWNVSNNISKAYFELVLADFAKSVGAGRKRRIVLQLDNAGWRGPENLVVPDGIRLVFQPAHSPELQPAEHLWAFVDEPLVNGYFETIEDLGPSRGPALSRTHLSAGDDTRQHALPLVAAPASQAGYQEVITRRIRYEPSQGRKVKEQWPLVEHGGQGAVRMDCVGAFAELKKARLVAKLRHARERIRNERGKCEGRKTRIERAERENKPELVKALTEAVDMAKRLRRASPKTGECRSLRKISAELAAAGHLNERGQPFNPNSIKLMLEG